MKIRSLIFVGLISSTLLVGCDELNKAKDDVAKTHTVTKSVESHKITQDESLYVDYMEIVLKDYLDSLNNVVSLIEEAEINPLLMKSKDWKNEMRAESKLMYNNYKDFEEYDNVPDSLKDIHEEAVGGLSLIYLGVFDIIEGVDKDNNDMIEEGGAFIRKGSTRIDKANELVTDFKNKSK